MPTWRTGAGADAVRRAGEVANETVRRGAQAVAESQRQIVQDAAERFEEVSRKVAEAARGTTENVRQLMALPNAAEGGLRDLQQGMTSLFEGVVQTNLRVAQELFRLANPAPLVELQQRFVREYTDTLLRNGATLVRAVRRTAEQRYEEQPRDQVQAEHDGRADGDPAPTQAAVHDTPARAMAAARASAVLTAMGAADPPVSQSRSRCRARKTRLLAVPTAQPCTAATSS